MATSKILLYHVPSRYFYNRMGTPRLTTIVRLYIGHEGLTKRDALYKARRIRRVLLNLARRETTQQHLLIDPSEYETIARAV